MNKLTLVIGIFFLFSFASAYAEEINIAEELERIDNHLHSPERWYGSCRSCGAGNYANESFQDFNCTSGANYYGTPVIIYGQLDMNDVNISYPYLDMHRIFVNGSTSSANIRFRVLWGKDCDEVATGRTATAEADGNYSDVMTSIDELFKGDLVSVPAILQMPQISTRQGIKICARCWSDTPNARLSFFVGMHFYKNDTYTSDIGTQLSDSWYEVGLALLAILFMWLSFQEILGELLTRTLRIGAFLWIVILTTSGIATDYTQPAIILIGITFVVYIFALFYELVVYFFKTLPEAKRNRGG